MLGPEVPETPPSSPFFNEIVGLRAYLALWVAVSHALQSSGTDAESNPVLTFLANGHAAVVVFMIVSGFVITNLLLGKQEGYPRYIVRRFFRLYPAYVICCIAGFFLSDDWVRFARAVPWQQLPRWHDYIWLAEQLDREVSVNFWQHFGLHAIMMHGAVPGQVLNQAAMTFVPAAWSISLEWQFYLVAPLVIAGMGNRCGVTALAITAMALHLAFYRGWLGDYFIWSMLAGFTPYFAIGIGSRLAFHTLAKLRMHPIPAAVVMIYAAAVLTEDAIPLAVWAAFYCYLLWQENDRLFGPAFRILTTSRPIAVTGEASYSLYLVHQPVQILVGSAAIGAMTLSSGSMLAILMAAVICSVVISIAMYFLIERPSIALGRRVVQHLPEHSLHRKKLQVVGPTKAN